MRTHTPRRPFFYVLFFGTAPKTPSTGGGKSKSSSSSAAAATASSSSSSSSSKGKAKARDRSSSVHQQDPGSSPTDSKDDVFVKSDAAEVSDVKTPKPKKARRSSAAGAAGATGAVVSVKGEGGGPRTGTGTGGETVAGGRSRESRMRCACGKIEREGQVRCFFE